MPLVLSTLLALRALAPADTTLLHQSWTSIWKRSFDSSIVAFESAAALARRTNDSASLASAHIAIGFLHSRKAGVDRALAHLDTAVRVAQPGYRGVEAMARCTRATILSFGGRPGASADALRGLALAEAAQHLRAIGWCRYARGSVAINESRDPAFVAALLDSALVSQQAAADTDWIGITHFTKGYLLQLIGDLAGAKRILAEARRVATSTGNRFTAGWVHRYLGDIHAATGDWVSADAEYRAASQDFSYLHDAFGMRGIKRSMAGAALALGRLDAAEAGMIDAKDDAAAAGMAEGEYSALLELVSIKWLRGDHEGAQRDLERVARYGLTTGHQGWVQELGYTRGLFALRRGDLDEAERHLRGFLREIAPELLVSRYAARARLAEVLVRQGRIDAGVSELRAAMDQLDSLRSTLNDRALRLLVFQTRGTLDEPGLGLATIAAALVRAGRVEEAFGLSERRRARLLAERMLRSRLTASASGAEGNEREPTGADPPRAALPAGTALVEFLAGYAGQPSVAFILTPGGIAAEILPAFDSLAGPAERLVALLASGEPADREARALGAALMDPVLRRIPEGISQVQVVPDGFLHRVPLDALILSDGKPLLDRFAIAMVPSAAVGSALRNRAPHPGATEVLAFGDPRFAVGPERTGEVDQAVYGEAFDVSGGLPRLEASAREARNAARYSAHGEVRLRGEASEAFLKHAPRDRFRVVHFATHALVDERSPARTALALAPGQGEDGFVGPQELAELGIGADLIVLSACRTAGGAVVEGEGIQGLTAPLLESGARAVVATLWPVPDDRAAAFTADFYDRLARGLTVGEALRAVKLAQRDAGAPAGEWAAFTVVGDPGLTIPLRRRGSFGLGTAVAFGGAALAILLAQLAGRRLLAGRVAK